MISDLSTLLDDPIWNLLPDTSLLVNFQSVMVAAFALAAITMALSVALTPSE